jgi:predicted short-subunit dehydrogenase-like oxidoreductase (DUF2520 family)
MSLSLNIIGAGNVGRVLGRLFQGSGAFKVQDVLTRSRDSAAAAVRSIGAGRAVDDLAALRAADATMLAVPDDQIAGTCTQLALKGLLQGTLVFHCSGARSSAELRTAVAKGAVVASVHPIRSFADPNAVLHGFEGTWCGIEGDDRALAILTPALVSIGARPGVIDAAAKPVYHAAAVFASNYLVTVVDAALRAYQAAGIPERTAREMVRPLATETLGNVLRLGPEAALSGPIARGDSATVLRQQIGVTAWDGPTGALYAALADATGDLARRKNDLQTQNDKDRK